MELKNKKYVFEFMVNALKDCVSKDYLPKVCGYSIDDVCADLDASADKEFNDDDIRLAVGRVFCVKMGIE